MRPDSIAITTMTAYQIGSMPATVMMGLKIGMVMHNMEIESKKHPRAPYIKAIRATMANGAKLRPFTNSAMLSVSPVSTKKWEKTAAPSHYQKNHGTGGNGFCESLHKEFKTVSKVGAY